MYELSWDNKYEMQKVTLVPVGDRYAEIDVEDWERVKDYKWYLVRFKYGTSITYLYARSVRKQGGVLMHRLILGLTDSQIQADHRNFDGLDNTKSNLRPANTIENHRNQRPWNKIMQSTYKGISRNGDGWMARIGVNRERIYLGTFNTEKEAVLAYNEAAKEHFGEFAYLNKI